MLTKEYLTSKFLNVINDSVALAQLFVVVLFFENHAIIALKTTLFSTTLDLSSISLAPFIWFLIFIALSKVMYSLLFTVKAVINVGVNFDFRVNKKVHFTSFLLMWLSAVYSLNILHFHIELVPVDKEQHEFLHNLFISLPLYTFAVSAFIYFAASISDD